MISDRFDIFSILRMEGHVLNSAAATYIDDCISAPSSTREGTHACNQFITAVNSFHPALKYIWEIFDTSLQTHRFS